ncbi:hypothetical protein BJY52DRAFT_1356175 [Lactarius psammicola]|nr:hypothetical protein BJY52DRAFT_1356175 [Lactarius psammicola]
MATSIDIGDLSRLFLEISPGKPDQTDALKSLLDIVDKALTSAVEAREGRHSSDVADKAFSTAEEQLDVYALSYHAREHGVVGNVANTIREASQEDSQIMKSIIAPDSKADTPRSSSLVKVRFRILRSPTDRSQVTVVTCELGPEVNISELLWAFSRLPKDQQVTLKQNPHFYLSSNLPDRPRAYNSEFVLRPLGDLKFKKDVDVSVLADRSGQIYFDYKEFSKTYGNIWKPHDTIILKGNHHLQGTLEAANQINPKIDGEVCIWKRGGNRPNGGLTKWTEVLGQALSAPDADWLIRSEISASGIGATDWEYCSPIKEPEPAPAPGLGNSATSAPSREEVFTSLEDAPNLYSDRIITPNLPVSTFHVSPQHTHPEFPIPPIGNDKAAASDGGFALLDSTTTQSESFHLQPLKDTPSLDLGPGSFVPTVDSYCHLDDMGSPDVLL